MGFCGAARIGQEFVRERMRIRICRSGGSGKSGCKFTKIFLIRIVLNKKIQKKTREAFAERVLFKKGFEYSRCFLFQGLDAGGFAVTKIGQSVVEFIVESESGIIDPIDP